MGDAYDNMVRELWDENQKLKRDLMEQRYINQELTKKMCDIKNIDIELTKQSINT